MMEWIRALLCLPQGASSFADEVDGLHFAVITTTMIGSTIVLVAAVWFVIRYRRRGDRDRTPRVVGGKLTEGGFIGFIVVLFCTFWLVGYRQYARMETPPDDALVVYVTAKQWMWKFGYPDGTSTIDELTVPSGRAVKLVMTSRDVIHSFYVPAFRIKQDVLPDRYVTAWFTATEQGSYDLFCAEYCGVWHSRMKARVVVLSPSDYARWIDARAPARAAQADLASLGRDVAAKRACLSCHTLDGQPHVAPSFAGLYGSYVATEDGTLVLADDAYLTRSMMDPRAEIVRGYKPLMPTYRGVLTEPETAALVELIRSLRAGPIAPSVALPNVADQPRSNENDGGTP